MQAQKMSPVMRVLKNDVFGLQFNISGAKGTDI